MQPPPALDARWHDPGYTSDLNRVSGVPYLGVVSGGIIVRCGSGFHNNQPTSRLRRDMEHPIVLFIELVKAHPVRSAFSRTAAKVPARALAAAFPGPHL